MALNTDPNLLTDSELLAALRYWEENKNKLGFEFVGCDPGGIPCMPTDLMSAAADAIERLAQPIAECGQKMIQCECCGEVFCTACESHPNECNGFVAQFVSTQMCCHKHK